MKFSTNRITIIADHPVGLTAILVIKSVSTFKAVVILYLSKQKGKLK
jgi:hypothetical protein